MSSYNNAFDAVVHGASVRILRKSTGLQVGSATVLDLKDYDDAYSEPDRNERNPKMVKNGVQGEETVHLNDTTPKTVDDGTT